MVPPCMVLVFAGLAAAAQDAATSFPPLPAGLASITVLDRQGRYLGRILPQKRYGVTLERVPEVLR